MKNLLLLMLAMTIVATSASIAQISQLRWSDNMESYALGTMSATPPVGSNPVTSGGWDSWDQAAVFGDIVIQPNASNPNNQALEITADDDHLWHFTNNLLSNGGHNTGRGTWVFEIDCYYPSTTSGPSWYIIENDYNHFGPYNWSVQMKMDGLSGLVTADYGSSQCASAPFPLDRWFTFRTEAYMDVTSTAAGKGWTRTWILDPLNPAGATSTLLLTCNPPNVPDPRLGEGYNWVDGVFGSPTNNGMLQFENLDLYGDPTQVGPVYYDNPRCWEKPDLLHIITPTTTTSGVPYIDAMTGGTADLWCNGDYQDDQDTCLILAGFQGSSPGIPLPGPGGTSTILPINLPDELFLLMLGSPNLSSAWPNNVESFVEYGIKPNLMQFILPPFPLASGSGFTFNFGAVVWDTMDPSTGGVGSFTFRWADGGSLQFD